MVVDHPQRAVRKLRRISKVTPHARLRVHDRLLTSNPARNELYHFLNLANPLLHWKPAAMVVVIFDVECWQDVANLRRVHSPKFSYRGLSVRIWMTTEICAV